MVIVISDPAVVEDFRVVRKSDFVVDAITARRVLSRLLQIKNSAHIIPEIN